MCTLKYSSAQVPVPVLTSIISHVRFPRYQFGKETYQMLFGLDSEYDQRGRRSGGSGFRFPSLQHPYIAFTASLLHFRQARALVICTEQAMTPSHR